MMKKRQTTCISDHPNSSKWWCNGAILKMRLPWPVPLGPFEVAHLHDVRYRFTDEDQTYYGSRSHWPVISATTASVAPSASAPVSP